MGYAALVREVLNTYNILVRKPRGKVILLKTLV